jgi:hypothetical protein
MSAIGVKSQFPVLPERLLIFSGCVKTYFLSLVSDNLALRLRTIDAKRSLFTLVFVSLNKEVA